jgi:hypothetical protein
LLENAVIYCILFEMAYFKQQVWQKRDNPSSPTPDQISMPNDTGVPPITISLLGIAFVLHFSAAPYYFIGSPPTGFSTGTLGLVLCVVGVLLAGVAAARKE